MSLDVRLGVPNSRFSREQVRSRILGALCCRSESVLVLTVLCRTEHWIVLAGGLHLRACQQIVRRLSWRHQRVLSRRMPTIFRAVSRAPGSILWLTHGGGTTLGFLMNIEHFIRDVNPKWFHCDNSLLVVASGQPLRCVVQLPGSVSPDFRGRRYAVAKSFRLRLADHWAL